MNPIYKFTLAANGGDEQQAFPVYRDDLAKDFELQTNQEFYRAKLSGKLTFVRDDYDFIASQSFDTQFGIKIYISYDAGYTWAEYWAGNFWKTNCTFDDDNKNVTLTPDVVDRYTEILAGMEKEYNLIDLAPSIVPINLDKRPMIQVYIPGQTVIACFLSGMWWEQECDAVDNENNLVNTYHFDLNTSVRTIEVTQTGNPTLPWGFYGTPPSNVTNNYDFTNDGYKFAYIYTQGAGGVPDVTWQIIKTSTNTVMWQYHYQGGNPPVSVPNTIVLQPVSGSGASGTVSLYISDKHIYARYLTDVEGSGTYALPADDIVENNRNYHRVIGYDVQGTIWYHDHLSETPTKWGLYQPGLYYEEYTAVPVYRSFPIARNTWGRLSYWFSFSTFDWLIESAWRKPFTLKDAYPLASAISVLLKKIAPNVTHEETTDYSQFLYGTNPLLGINQRIFITPKSNMISLGYDQPAQKAPITLKRVLDMLRDCFRCYWFIDDENRFRIEHIEYFRRGGAYTGTPVVGRDLTVERVTRNGKKWAFGTSEFKYDKPEMASRYQFGWMDDVTEPFIGNPMDILSAYVNPDNIEQIEISQFTSDVDYILLNPSDISKDGFVLLAATLQSGEYKLPYITFGDIRAQNGYAAFRWLQQYYFWDMPAPRFTYNGTPTTAYGVKKLKTQTLKFPAFTDPNTLQLIKTNLGNGTIQKLSINLSSRNAQTTLMYDTE